MNSILRYPETTLQALPSTSPNGLSSQHRKFAEGIAMGMNGVDAYRAAYPGVKETSARSNASRLISNADIRREVARIREEARSKADSAALTLQEMLQRLAAIVRARPSEAGEHNALCEMRMGRTGPVYVFPDKLKALELHAKLSGELTDKIQVSADEDLRASLAAMVDSIRK